MTTETEIGMMWPQAKECPQSLEAGRAKNGFSPRAYKGNVVWPIP